MHRFPEPHPLPPRPLQTRSTRDAADLHDPLTRAWLDHLDAGRIGTPVPPQPGARDAAERTAALFRRLAGAAR